MPMIIVEVVRESASQMGLVEHDQAVQTFPAEGAEQALDKRILPKGARRNAPLFQAKVKPGHWTRIFLPCRGVGW